MSKTLNLVGSVLLGSTLISSMVFVPSVKAQSATLDIVETARAAGNFSSLLTALDRAELTSALKGPGPFTVFAPTNDAFAKLPSETLNSLLNDASKKNDLADILKYHVVSGRVAASQVVTLNQATTLQGGTISIKVQNNEVILNNSVKVTQTDIQASNGIIHVIDAVLLPTAKNSDPLVRSGGFNIASLLLIGASFSLMTSMLVLSNLNQKQHKLK
ncbi:MAG: hypothetical protein OHK0017_11100 [Patescibacteria group bacterium]